MRTVCPRKREAIEKNVLGKYLELSRKGKTEKETGRALDSKGFDKSKSKGTKSGKNNSRNQKSMEPMEYFRCGLLHMLRDCQARIIKAPFQEAETDSKKDSGELVELRALAASVSLPCYEEWYGDTGAPQHVTDSLRCMRDVTPVNFNTITGVGGVRNM